MPYEPLTDRDYQRLASSLDQFKEQGCMNLEQLDGFFTALLVSPMPIQPTECLPLILGQAFDDESAFASAKALDRFANLLMRHWLDIEHTLCNKQPFHPWLEADAQGLFRGNDWTQGFMQGVELQYDDWLVLLDDPQHPTILAPIMALAYEQQPEQDMQPYLAEVSNEQRMSWLSEISPTVSQIHQFFAAIRRNIDADLKS